MVYFRIDHQKKNW